MKTKYDPFKDKVSMHDFCEMHYIDYRRFLDEYYRETLPLDHRNTSHYEQWYCERNDAEYLVFVGELNYVL